MISTTSDHAVPFARTALEVLRTRHPYGSAHSSLGDADTDVTPERLHPAFHGALDWHSSVHMQWSLVQLLAQYSQGLGRAGLSAEVITLLDERLTPAHCAVEAAYLRERPGYERPYGWAWALQLAAACTAAAAGERWAAALAPLTELLAVRVPDWLARQAYPVRHGVHANTAFSLDLIMDAAATLGLRDLQAACRDRAVEWFGADTAADSRWEPSGTDFLSPALAEAALMVRVLDASAYAIWLADFLPGLGSGQHETLFETPEVRDMADGQFVHLCGLALSRAAHLRRIADTFPADDRRRSTLLEAASTQAESALAAVTRGDFMATHWLVSFALLALPTAAG